MDFQHSMAAHCETGTMKTHLELSGIKISEPMILGITGGLFFAYLDTKSFHFPTIAVRSRPGSIKKQINREMKVSIKSQRFISIAKGIRKLDQLLLQGKKIAAQVDMFYMDYFPEYMRAHFNGHFLTVLGKEGDKYIISDPYKPEITTISEKSFNKGRFARGMEPPRGHIYYTEPIKKSPDLRKAIKNGIKKNCRSMLKIPFPFLGIKGIRHFAEKITDWPDRARDEEYLSHQIMSINIILEERGTGGAGFRFMYATFLQEAAELLNSANLRDISKQMMENGDNWRELSLFAARMGKRHDFDKQSFNTLKAKILKRADSEEAIFRKLADIQKEL